MCYLLQFFERWTFEYLRSVASLVPNVRHAAPALEFLLDLDDPRLEHLDGGIDHQGEAPGFSRRHLVPANQIQRVDDKVK
jgi:hypothetical protein